MRFFQEPEPEAPFNPHKLFHGVWIPDGLLNYRKLSPGAKLCYAALVRFAGANGRCWPSRGKVMGLLGVSEAQVKRYVLALIKEKLIRRDARPGRSNNFIFLWHPVFSVRTGLRKDVHISRNKN